MPEAGKFTLTTSPPIAPDSAKLSLESGAVVVPSYVFDTVPTSEAVSVAGVMVTDTG